MKPTYIKTKFNNTVNISKIITVHYYEFDKSFSFEGESHDFWEMVYVDQGKVEIQCDEKKMILGQGEIIFHKAKGFEPCNRFSKSLCFPSILWAYPPFFPPKIQLL